MYFQANRIIQDVRVCLDENRTDTQLLSISDEDTLKLDEIIRSKIVEGVDRVQMAAPFSMLELGHSFHDAPLVWEDMESGWVKLPAEFMRLVVFEMDDWERPVYVAITPIDPEYKKQKSRIKAIRGTAQRPVCVIAKRPIGNVLEFYSCKTEDARITRAIYIPYAELNASDMVDMSERCYDAVVWTIAGLTLVSCGEADKANVYFDKANTLLER